MGWRLLFLWPAWRDDGMTLGIRMWLVCFVVVFSIISIAEAQRESSSPRGGRAS